MTFLVKWERPGLPGENHFARIEHQIRESIAGHFDKEANAPCVIPTPQSNNAGQHYSYVRQRDEA